MTIFNKTFEACGWRAVTELSDTLGYVPHARVPTWRKGHVRIELTSNYLVDRDHIVSFYTNDGKPWGTLSCIMVDFGHRGKGLGHKALLDVLSLTDALEWDRLYLEAVSISRRGTGKSEMNDLSLRYWYDRHGFKQQPRYKHEGGEDGLSNRVMMRLRPGIVA